MRKSAFSLFTVLLLAVIVTGACDAFHLGKQAPARLQHLDSIARLLPAALTDSLRQAAYALMKTETDYYLERHNVQDEGYEMVAAFAQGQRHHITIDTIPVWNIGRWKGKKRQPRLAGAYHHRQLGGRQSRQWHTHRLSGHLSGFIQ